MRNKRRFPKAESARPLDCEQQRGHLSNCGGGSWGDSGIRSDRQALSVNLGLGALARDVTGLATAIASLSSSIQRAAIRSSAVTGDVTEFPAGVALHCLRLAIPSVVVRPTTFVARRGTRPTSKSAAETTVSAARNTCTTTTGYAAVGASALRIHGYYGKLETLIDRQLTAR